MNNYAEVSRGEYNRRYDNLLYEEDSMGITASKNSDDFEKFIFPPNRYDAVCFQVVDLGTHEQQFQNKKPFKARKCLIGFEIPSELMELDIDGDVVKKPRVISRQLTVSLSEKSNMRPLLESWRGKPFTPEEEEAFDISKLVGCTCELQVINKISKSTNNPYHFIQNMLTPRDGVKKIETITPTVYFSFEDNEPIPDMPDWITKEIEASFEWQDIHADASDAKQEEPPPAGDEDIPF